MLRGTHHDPDLSRPEVHPEQRCCFKHSASSSRLPRSESRPLKTGRSPPSSPASAGFFHGFLVDGSGCLVFQRSNQTATPNEMPMAMPAPMQTIPNSTGMQALQTQSSSARTDQSWQNSLMTPTIDTPHSRGEKTQPNRQDRDDASSPVFGEPA